MEKYNILYIINSSENIYGNERDLLRLLEGSDRSRFNNFIICTREGPLVKYLKMKGENVEVIPQKNSFNLLTKIKLFKFIKRNDIDLIHSYFSRVDGIVAKLLNVPFVQKRNFPPARTFSISRLPIIDKILDRFVDKIITVSDSLRHQAIQRGIKADKITTIHYGIDAKKYRNSSINKIQKCKELKLRPDLPIVGTMGRLATQKGQRYLLEAIPKVLQEFPQVQFLIAGEGNLKPKLMSLTERSGINKNVRFLGYRKDISEILSVLDIFALPSLWEGLPFVVLEAMAKAKPVVATDVDGIPEAVVDRVTGILVPPRNSRKLTEAILRLLKNSSLRKTIGENGRRRVEKFFKLESMCRQTEEIYLQLLNSRKANFAKVRLKEFGVNLIRRIVNLMVDFRYASAFIFQYRAIKTRRPLGRMEKALIINLSKIGDTLCSTPAIRAIKKNYPNLHLTMIVDKQAKEVILGNPHIDRVISYDDRSWREFLKIIKKIRSENFDLSILFFGRIKGSLLALLSRAKNHTGFLNNNLYEIKKFGSQLAPAKMMVSRKESLITKHLKITEFIGCNRTDANLEIFLKDEEEKYVSELLYNFGVAESDLVICLNPETNWNCKKWDEGKFAQLGDCLYGAYGAKIVITGSPSGVKIAQRIVSLMNHQPIILAGKTAIRELAAILRRCNLLITVDSAPLHIAQAVGTSTITLFGPTNYRIVLSRHKKDIAIWKGLSCSPCYNGLHQPICNNFKCMDSITVDCVLQAAEAQLKEGIDMIDKYVLTG